MLKEVDPRTAHRWVNEGRAVLIDIRDQDEYAREHITGARLAPLSSFDAADFSDVAERTAVFQCATGRRTAMNADRLLSSAFSEAYCLQGGLAAWKQAGLPVHRDRSAPLDLRRQTQLAAGALVVAGVVLGAVVSPWFNLLSGAVGAGLVLAGATGWCGMSEALARMPWNRRLAANATTNTG